MSAPISPITASEVKTVDIRDQILARATLPDLMGFFTETAACDPIAMGRLFDIIARREAGVLAAKARVSAARKDLAGALGLRFATSAAEVAELNSRFDKVQLERENRDLAEKLRRAVAIQPGEIATMARALVLASERPWDACDPDDRVDVVTEFKALLERAVSHAARFLADSPSGGPAGRSGPANTPDHGGCLTVPTDAPSAPRPRETAAPHEHIPADLLTLDEAPEGGRQWV